MTEFLDALRKIQAVGSSVLLASFDDAAEQPAARLKVLYVHDCGTKFDIEHEAGGVRTYRTANALWVEDEHGRVENRSAQEKLRGFQARRKKWALRQEELRDLTSPLDASNNLVELPGTHNGVEKAFFAYRDKFSERLTVFLAKPTYAPRMVTLIGEGGSVWTAIDMLLQGEFLWPIWIRQQEEANPGDESHDYESAFDWGERTPGEIIRLFFARGWQRHQMFMPSPDHIDKKTAGRLRTHGLVVTASEAPIEILVQYMPANELKAPIKARGIKPGDKAAVQSYYAERMDADYERVLRASTWLYERQCFLPPRGFTWATWHAFRTSYADMFDAMTNWAAGNFEPEKYAALV